MKFWKITLALMVMLAAVLVFAACDEGVTPPVDEACEHTYESAVTAEPTCTKEGTTTYTCSKCQDSYTEAIAATGKHTYTETVTAPTCTAEGYTTYTCACGDTYKGNTVAATGHTYTDTVVAPTCAAEGYTTHTCACGETYKDNTVPATGEHTYTEKVTAPTCTAEGYTTYTCACGKSYKDNTVAATGHDYTEKVTEEATCSKEGKATYTCSKCNDSYTAATSKKEHTYAAFTAHAPTCDTKGEEQTKCEVCGDVYYSKVLEATGHSYTSSVTAPTCLADGYTTYTCSACGHSYRDNVIAASKEYHVFVPSIIALTEEEAAQNPDAIAIATMACKICGEADANAAKKAILVNLTFDEALELGTYEGSENYQAVLGEAPTEAQKQTAAYIDTQKNLDCWGSIASGAAASVQDGKLVLSQTQLFAKEVIPMLSTKNPYDLVTITVDIGINRDPSKMSTNYGPTATLIAWTDSKLWNNYPLEIALDMVDADPDENVKKFRIIVESCVNKSNQLDKDKSTTGAFVELGKEYTFKVIFMKQTATAVIFYRELGATSFTLIGSFDGLSLPSTAYNAIRFNMYTEGTGNTFDNYMVTTPANVGDTAPACSHSYLSALTKAETCGADGEILYACEKCGQSYTEAIPATGAHVYAESVVAPTCTTDGYTRHICVCGDYYDDTPVLATGEHTYEAASPVAPTCGVEGYTRYTCTACGDYYDTDPVPATGEHSYVYGVYELTEAQTAANPHAIGVEGSLCSVCGAVEPETDATAIIIDLDFNTPPADVDAYVGSEKYQTALTNGGSKITPAYKSSLVYFDSQKNMDAHSWGASGGIEIRDGKLLPTATGAFYVTDPLQLASLAPALTQFTITFDLTVNADPTAYTKYTNTPIWSMHNTASLYNDRTLALALDKTNVSTESSQKTFRLQYDSYRWGLDKPGNCTALDFYVTLGVEYSFKLEFSISGSTYQVHLYAKEKTAATYTDLGVHNYQAHTAGESAYSFSLGKNAGGNEFDNFKVVAPFVK